MEVKMHLTIYQSNLGRRTSCRKGLITSYLFLLWKYLFLWKDLENDHHTIKKKKSHKHSCAARERPFFHPYVCCIFFCVCWKWSYLVGLAAKMCASERSYLYTWGLLAQTGLQASVLLQSCPKQLCHIGRALPNDTAQTTWGSVPVQQQELRHFHL